MASDFGDEAGGELYNWMLRIGQDAGEQAMRDAAKNLASALRNLRSGAERADEIPPESTERPRWAKLDIAEIDALPNPKGARRALSERMDDAGVDHAFVDDPAGEHGYLLFRTDDASRLYSCIDELLEEVGDIADRAAGEIAKQREPGRQPLESEHAAERDTEDPDKEPLEKQAEYARAASEQIERERSGGRAAEHGPRFQENRSK